MTRDGEAYGGGPLRRGNTNPSETPDLVEHVPLTPEDDDDWPTLPGYVVSATRAAQAAEPAEPASGGPAPAEPAPTAPTEPARPDTAPTAPAGPAPTAPAESVNPEPARPGSAPAVPTTRAAAAAAAAANRPAAPAAPVQTPIEVPRADPGPAPTGPAAPQPASPIPPAPQPPIPSASAASPTAPASPVAPTSPATPATPVVVPTTAGIPRMPTAPTTPPTAPTARVAPSQPGLVQSVPTSPAPSPGTPQSATPAATAQAVPPQPAAPHTLGAPAGPTADPSAGSRREQREQGSERRSFLQQDPREDPARRGGRGFLNRLGFSLGPNASERAQRDDEHAVSRHWPGPRTVAVVNGKGGAGKTPATVLLSAVFAQYGGAGVLAWDNNQTRGTLGWRTETGAHDRTLLELLPQTQRLLGAQGQSADLAHFVHHQPQEKYDVLRSKPIRLAHENRLSPADVDAIHAVAAKFYRLIIIDSGNDESDPMWLRMIDRADQLVVATTTRDDHAEAGALLLEALEDRDERSAHLARQAVVVVSQADPKATSAEIAEVVAGYQPLAREVVQIPYDREMVDGHLRLRALASPTQEAWLSAAAAVARGF